LLNKITNGTLSVSTGYIQGISVNLLLGKVGPQQDEPTWGRCVVKMTFHPSTMQSTVNWQ
jgi:hypothetical protein